MPTVFFRNIQHYFHLSQYLKTLFKVATRTQIISYCIWTCDIASLVKQHPQKDEHVLQPSLPTTILHAAHTHTKERKKEIPIS